MYGKIAKRIYGFVMSLVLQCAFLYAWIPVEGGKANSISVLLRILRADDAVEEAYGIVSLLPGFSDAVSAQALGGDTPDSVAIKFILFLGCLCAAQALCALYVPLSLFGKGLMLCGVSGIVFLTGAVMLAQDFVSLTGSGEVGYYTLILLALTGFIFIGTKLAESITEATREMRELRKRDREFKKERKRRLRFPGAYSSLFYHIIWSNCRVRIKDYVIFVIAGSVAVSFNIAGAGMWAMLGEQEVGALLVNFLGVSLVVSIFILVNILLFYLNNRMKGYGILLNLGMRRMTLRLYMTVELLVCILLSLVIGFLFGNGLVLVLKKILTARLGGDVITGGMNAFAWMLAGGSTLLMFLVSLMLTRDNYYGPEKSGTADKAVMAEPVGVKHKVLSLLAGFGFLEVSREFLQVRSLTENLWLFGAFLAGLYIIVKTVWGIWLGKREKFTSLFYRRLLKDNYKYYRFKTTYRYLFFLALLHTVMLSVLLKDVSAISIAEEGDSLFPYDYVCMADEADLEGFEKLEKEGLVESDTYPMVRVSTLDSTPDMEGPESVLVNGLHIGISVSTYEKLCERVGREPEELRLSGDGKDIYIIYQQDLAQEVHQIDYYMLEELPHLRFGSPEVIWANPKNPDYRVVDENYPQREIYGAEKHVYTGALVNGEQENIVVFSDEYLDSAEYEGTDRLVLLNLTGEEARSEVEETLQKFREKHAEEEMFSAEIRSCYDKRDMVSRVNGERVMKMTVNLFLVGILTVAGFLMLYMKVEAEMDTRKKQHTFLALTGMGPKAAKKVIRSEFLTYFTFPLVAAAAVTAGFTWHILKLRMYTETEMLLYAKTWGKCFLIYALLWAAGILFLGLYTERKVGRE